MAIERVDRLAVLAVGENGEVIEQAVHHRLISGTRFRAQASVKPRCRAIGAKS
jgi:hypothetical protein